MGDRQLRSFTLAGCSPASSWILVPRNRNASYDDEDDDDDIDSKNIKRIRQLREGINEYANYNSTLQGFKHLRLLFGRKKSKKLNLLNFKK